MRLKNKANFSNLEKKLITAKQNPSLDNAFQIAWEIINILGIDWKEQETNFLDDLFEKNKYSVKIAPGYDKFRASYELIHHSDKPIDFKLYWVEKITKSNITNLVALTPNFEDKLVNGQYLYKYKNIGIDFIVPKQADALIIILAKDHQIRSLELKGKLNNTQKKILENWYQDFDNPADNKTDPYAEKWKSKTHQILWNSFDISIVNKDFYKDIAEFFNELVVHLQNHNLTPNNSAQFANRLIGRLVFCWFLEKKELLNPQEKYFTVNTDTAEEYYRTKLEKLFFCTLNTPLDKRWKKLIEIETGIDSQTPFLNGGLFEPQSNDFWQEKNKLSFPTKFFDRFFKFLKHYNFTTDENTTDYQQIAIDPEMLGRIFENLLAEQVEETGQQARKAKGTFYTPREIVDYMCKESLKTHLLTKLSNKNENINEEIKRLVENLVDSKEREWQKEKANLKIKDYRFDLLKILDKIEVLDPACGSGAFLLGMLQLMLQVYERLEPRYSQYQTKMTIIQNNLFGVDIEPMAVEITKLRAWLSIIVDEQLNPTAENMGVKPLPNLDFKFVCANSLIPAPEEKSYQEGMFVDDFFSQLEKAVNNFFNPLNPEDKEKTKKEIKKIIKGKITQKIKDINNTKNFGSSEEAKEHNEILDLWASYNHIFEHNQPVKFFETKYFFPQVKEGFDVVVGNPPYIQLQKNGGKLANMFKNCNYQSFARTGDIYCLFYEFANQILKEKGHLVFITSNKWMRAGYGKKLRKYLSQNTTPKQLIDLWPWVFETATVDTNILLFQKEKNKTNCLACSVKENLKKENIELVDYIQKNKITLNEFSNKAWIILNPIERKIKEKIEKIGTPLKDWDIKINRGVLTGFNEAFIIDGKKKEELIKKDPKNAEIIKPILRGKDIKRYKAEFADLWLIATLPAMKLNIDDYPIIKEHLLSYGKKLEQTGKEYIDNNGIKQKSRKKTCNKWFETQDQICYYKEFEKEKIVWGNINYKANFCFDKGDFINAPANLLTSNKTNVKYFLTIMNSKIFSWEFENLGIPLGKAFEWKKQYVEKIHIPKISPTQQTPFISKIDQILAITSQTNYDPKNPPQEQKDLEKEIDEMVYELYGLTAEEVGVVEG